MYIFLKNLNAYQHHYEAKKKHLLKFAVPSLDDQWQADLVDLNVNPVPNGHKKYVLSVIDIFSRYGWGIPLRNKTDQEVITAFKKIFEQGGIPRKIQTDMGTEFVNSKFNQLMEDNNITHIYTANPSKTSMSIVERFNQTIENKSSEHY